MQLKEVDMPQKRIRVDS